MNSVTRIRRVRPLPPAIPPFPVRKFMVAEYHKLLKAGIFRSGDPYELLKGWIVPKLRYRSSPNFASSATGIQ